MSGDFNGDGLVDSAVVASAGSPGAWTFEVYVQLTRRDGGYDEFTVPLPPLPAAAQGSSVYLRPVTADFTGDGRDDLLVGVHAGSDMDVAVAVGSATGGLRALNGWQVLSGAGIGTIIGAGDTNGDGRADLVLNMAEGEDCSVLPCGHQSDDPLLDHAEPGVAGLADAVPACPAQPKSPNPASTPGTNGARGRERRR